MCICRQSLTFLRFRHLSSRARRKERPISGLFFFFSKNGEISIRRPFGMQTTEQVDGAPFQVVYFLFFEDTSLLSLSLFLPRIAVIIVRPVLLISRHSCSWRGEDVPSDNRCWAERVGEDGYRRLPNTGRLLEPAKMQKLHRHKSPPRGQEERGDEWKRVPSRCTYTRRRLVGGEKEEDRNNRAMAKGKSESVGLVSLPYSSTDNPQPKVDSQASSSFPSLLAKGFALVLFCLFFSLLQPFFCSRSALSFLRAPSLPSLLSPPSSSVQPSQTSFFFFYFFLFARLSSPF